MKREIICLICKEVSRKLFPTDNPYPGEYVVFTHGYAKKQYICDHCGTDIFSHGQCFGFTIHTGEYFNWEKEFLYPNV